ncbi:unnamed protein product [Ostreobium quekettii]|uniref:Thiamine phosphate synthase/TenI domain-containing protein n=1 Tax=Ostreobium quekettii TaxID=121088 RepID=A0A8S1J5V0_9CHLO|nr:unnamed protein product [Ostreobium quekettii]|eukprot:evm.model.scf_1396EXC.2 EVM.evm.TU.scf_1396EXC.2   scf_1396EXC:17802-19174(-)
MDLVVITPPVALAGEVETANRLFGAGLGRLHLRRPGFEEAEVEAYVAGVDAAFRGRVVVHGHHRLAGRWRLKGIHYTESTRPPFPIPSPEPPLTVSTSFHQLDQLKITDYGALNYAFLSPIFDSISKPGLKASMFDCTSLMAALLSCPIPIFALGGIAPDKVPSAAALGFSGVAVLGSIWQSSDPVAAFLELKEACDRVGPGKSTSG